MFPLDSDKEDRPIGRLCHLRVGSPAQIYLDFIFNNNATCYRATLAQ